MGMDVRAWVIERGGAAHTSDAYEAGFSKYRIARAVEAGGLERVRRSWLIDRDCGARLATAVRAGGTLTCVSAAAELGLWTPRHEGVHVRVPRTASRLSAFGIVAHRAEGPAPAPPHGLRDHPLNVLFHTARCLPPADALAVWEAAVDRRLVEMDELRHIRWRSSRAIRIARLARAGSQSGLETRFAELMRTHGVSFTQQVWVDGHPVDVVIGTTLVIQLDGFAFHSSSADRRRDIRADARLALRGYTVLRFDYRQVFFEPEYVVDTVLHAMARGLHAARPA